MKEMRLYHRVDRIHNELAALGMDADGPLREADLAPFDQYHYDGTAAVDRAIEALRLTPASRVLDVGSGLGGPARHIAEVVGCHVTALELQTDAHEVAAELTRRCGLGDRVEHVQGDILDGVPAPGAYDALASFLVFLHIGDRPRLFATCAAALRPGGRLYVEDFSRGRDPMPAEAEALRVKVQTPASLPTIAVYGEQLRAAGFDAAIEDTTAEFRSFTAERLAAFRASRERNLAIHGADIVEGLDDFYATVAGLYASGALGGVRITAELTA